MGLRPPAEDVATVKRTCARCQASRGREPIRGCTPVHWLATRRRLSEVTQLHTPKPEFLSAGTPFVAHARDGDLVVLATSRLERGDLRRPRGASAALA